MGVPQAQAVVAKARLLKRNGSMKKTALYIALLITTVGFSQQSLSQLLKKYNTGAVPYISAEDLSRLENNVVLLDAREPKEYKVSHLKNALHVGYDDFDIALVKKRVTNKKQKIIVYCSLGVRSEVVGMKLKAAGYTNIQNLYGGIFEWKNQNFKVYDASEKETENIHAYSKSWSKWLLKGTKVYD